MRIDNNKITVSQVNKYKCSSAQSNQNNDTTAKNVFPLSSEQYKSYANINFRGRVYDGTNFREELKQRAENLIYALCVGSHKK